MILTMLHLLWRKSALDLVEHNPQRINVERRMHGVFWFLGNLLYHPHGIDGDFADTSNSYQNPISGNIALRQLLARCFNPR